MDNKSALDVGIAAVAGRQHGVVSIGQLHEAGLSNTAVLKRCRAGRLHRVHRGVYAVGHLAPSIERRWMAAVLALAGDSAPDNWSDTEDRHAADQGAALSQRSAGSYRAVLSHRSAAALWRLLPPTDGPVDISVPGQGGRRRRQGIRIHRCQSLRSEHMTRHRGIPVTAPARTIADLRPVLPARELRRAIRQAEVLGLSTGLDVPPDRTRSELERKFLQLCARHGLPKPDVNVRIGSLLVDFLWEDTKLIVETDGYQYHRGKAAFEDDRSRDLELHALGYEVVRLAYRQVTDEPAAVAAALRATLKPARRVSSPMVNKGAY